MQKFLDRVVPTFKDANDVLVTGVSAGGAGAALTTVLVQRAFPNTKIKTVIDSGAFVSKAVYTECDQSRMRTLLRAEETFLADCGAACPQPNDYTVDFGVFLVKVLSDRPSGLISSTSDATMRSFYGIGQNGCTGTLDLLNPSVSAAAYRTEILAFRERIRESSAFGTFYPEGDQHTFLLYPEFYTASAGDVRLVDWFTAIVNGQNAGHAGP